MEIAIQSSTYIHHHDSFGHAQWTESTMSICVLLPLDFLGTALPPLAFEVRAALERLARNRKHHK